MRTYLVSYDLAKPHISKHVVAQAIMSAGDSWARPLETTWYVRTEETEAELEHKLARLLETDDGLLIQAVRGEALLTNTQLRWFRRRQAGIEIAEHDNVIAFPIPAAISDQTELPFAVAS